MTVYAVNAKNLALSEYAGLSVTDIAELAGRLYGCTTGGLVEFTGANDETVAIASYVLTGKMYFGSFEETRVARSYVRDRYANELLMTTIVDEVDGQEEAQEESYDYIIPGRVGARQHARAVRLRRDVKGAPWQFKLANVAGGGMTLRGWTVQPEGIEVDV